MGPTVAPTEKPTKVPTAPPTENPTDSPTIVSTTAAPTVFTLAPTATLDPTTFVPTTGVPTTAPPTNATATSEEDRQRILRRNDQKEEQPEVDDDGNYVNPEQWASYTPHLCQKVDAQLVHKANH